MNTDAAEVLRVFIAIKPSADVLEALGREQQALKKHKIRVSWVAPDNMHLTLAFLGDISSQMIEPLQKRIDTIARTHVPFECTIRGLGSFGPEQNPRIIWAGVHNPSPVLISLQHNVVESCRELDIQIESRTYHPHLTLGRIRSSNHVDALTLAIDSAKNTHFGSFDVDGVLLMKSHLESRGARYSVLNRSKLEGE